MGVILNNELPRGGKLGIWEISEDYDTLRSGLNLENEEVKRLEGFRNHARKLEWLSVRNLINELRGEPSRIIYNADRKPFLLDNSSNISISHSRNLTAILLSRTMRVGIDLEYMSHKISRVADRFIGETEKITGDPALLRYHLYIHWCAKEALYKICDKKDINFRKNLRIKPFEPRERGILQGTVDNIYGVETFPMEYFRMDEYVIVWCCKK
jgi:phosphopantetheinyl transferase